MMLLLDHGMPIANILDHSIPVVLGVNAASQLTLLSSPAQANSICRDLSKPDTVVSTIF